MDHWYFGLSQMKQRQTDDNGLPDVTMMLPIYCDHVSNSDSGNLYLKSIGICFQRVSSRFGVSKTLRLLSCRLWKKVVWWVTILKRKTRTNLEKGSYCSSKKYVGCAEGCITWNFTWIPQVAIVNSRYGYLLQNVNWATYAIYIFFFRVYLKSSTFWWIRYEDTSFLRSATSKPIIIPIYMGSIGLVFQMDFDYAKWWMPW